MLDLQQLQILAQLVDNMEIVSGRLEKAYGDNDGESFKKSKKEILDIQKKIFEISDIGDVTKYPSDFLAIYVSASQFLAPK